MKFTLLIIIVLTLGIFISCELSENDETISIEANIKRIIATDAGTYSIDGMEDTELEDFVLNKALVPTESSAASYSTMILDSNSVWRFGRRNMNKDREIIVEVETDSSATALITHHITGTFHVREFERVWLDDGSWERGDSVRFSEKPIDMNVNRHVNFRKRTNAAGEERWIPTSMTMAYGSSGEALDIQSLEWVAGDSVKLVTDFETNYYDRRHPLHFMMRRVNQLKVNVSNAVAGNAETVTGRFGLNQRPADADSRNRVKLQYRETLDTGEKVYGRHIPGVNRPQRHFKASLEALDQRTLYDHDYNLYSSSTLGFVYTLRRPARP